MSLPPVVFSTATGLKKSIQACVNSMLESKPFLTMMTELFKRKRENSFYNCQIAQVLRRIAPLDTDNVDLCSASSGRTAPNSLLERGSDRDSRNQQKNGK